MENSRATPTMIDSSDGSGRWFAGMGLGAQLAFDLEADGLWSYEDKICLAQVFAEGRCAIIDPLADREALAPLAAALTDPGIEKIAHGADYDVRLLKKGLGVGPVNLFDTMIAAQLTGGQRLGLAGLLEEHFNVVLDKKHQRADWSRRPLTPSMLDYAAADVTLLIPLSEILKEKLASLGRVQWAAEEFRLLEGAQPPGPKTPWCLDVKGAQKLSPRELAVLQALLELRDENARKRNRPPFKILSNQTLLEWAVKPPKTSVEVIDSPGVSKPAMERMASAILAAVAGALALPEERLPRRPQSQPRVHATAEELKRLERLKALRVRTAGELGLDQGLLVNTPTLERISRCPPESVAEVVRAELKKWQFEVVGEALVTAWE